MRSEVLPSVRRDLCQRTLNFFHTGIAVVVSLSLCSENPSNKIPPGNRVVLTKGKFLKAIIRVSRLSPKKTKFCVMTVYPTQVLSTHLRKRPSVSFCLRSAQKPQGEQKWSLGTMCFKLESWIFVQIPLGDTGERRSLLVRWAGRKEASFLLIVIKS